MNKKKIIVSIVVLIAIAFVAMLVAREIPMTGVPDSHDVLTLKDSVKLSNYTLYWYENGSPFTTPSTSFMSLAKSPCFLTDTTAVVTGDFILCIDHVSADTVYICSQFGFHTNERFNAAGLIFVNLGDTTGDFQRRLSVKKDVLVSSICK